jgi:2-(1,2-epoxy-1,2-dihydrophenyl)acetyl-CoA isomerase
MDQVLLVETIGAVRSLVLNRPDRLNSLTSEIFDALQAAFDDIATDPEVRAVLLTGAGRGFCAGADLLQGLSETTDLGDLIESYYNPLVRRMRALPKPIVCAVNGVAAGAGMNLALAADIVVAGKTASFTQAFVRIGLIPDAGGTYFLPRSVGDGRARALAMLGETISAEQAEVYGIVWKTFDDATLMTEALTIATNLAAKPGEAIAAMKRLFEASGRNSLDDQLNLERDLQCAMGKTQDFAEGVQAFLEKRPAVFNRNPIRRN